MCWEIQVHLYICAWTLKTSETLPFSGMWHCNLVNTYQFFRGICYLLHEIRRDLKTTQRPVPGDSNHCCDILIWQRNFSVSMCEPGCNKNGAWRALIMCKWTDTLTTLNFVLEKVTRNFILKGLMKRTWNQIRRVSIKGGQSTVSRVWTVKSCQAQRDEKKICLAVEIFL